MEPIETIELEYSIINIYQDDHSFESPREWDNMGTMLCWHRNYRLGDENPFKHPDSFEEWREENKKDIAVILPLFLYDHSGITMSTGSFHDPWDSGQVGWIYATKKDVRESFMVNRVTKSILERATKLLQSEVDTYDQYLRGDIYGYEVIDKITGEDLDSCWGFYGIEDVREQATEAAKYAQTAKQKEMAA